MNKNKFIQVFEYQKLRYDDSGAFQKHHFEAMVKYNEQNQNRYYTIIHKGIQFGSYVGAIQIGGLTIEILPKADNNQNSDKNLWQNVLLNMLRICKRIQTDTVSETQLKKRYNSVLDAYFDLFLCEVERLTNKGLIKKYRKHQSNQNALKGKLLFTQNIQKNIAHKERFFCENHDYNKDHLIHQIIFKGLLILKNIANDYLKDRLNRLLFEFQDFENIAIQQEYFNRIVLDRKSQDYESALNIAKLLILNYSPNLNHGNDNMLTILFDMNKLWEEYIFRVLNKYKPTGVEVFFQNSDKFWENKRIRPDIIVKTANDTFVIDTKWKITESDNPSDNDLKQMFIYNLHWNAEKSMLLYPKTDQFDSKFGVFHYNNSGMKCKLGFLEVTENNSIKHGSLVSKEILEKIIEFQ